MGLLDTVQGALDAVRKVEIAEEMTIEALFDKIAADESIKAIGTPELKKGLMGKAIVFPYVAMTSAKVTVKGKAVTITKDTKQGTKVSVGGFNVKGGKTLGDVKDGSSYFTSLADAITAAITK